MEEQVLGQVVRYVLDFQAMGGRNEVQLYASSESRAQEIFKSLVDETKRIEAKYSRFKSDSVVSMINSQAASAWIELDQETCTLVSWADQCFHASDGLFDITSGHLQRVWDFHSDKIPSEQELQEALRHVGWDRVQWQSPKIKFPDPTLHLDFGGLGKEYAVDRCAEICTQHGIKHALINFAGDVRAVGPKPDGSPWRIGVAHPRKAKTVLCYRNIYRGGMATSGDYERFKLVQGTRYCHILNPRTGMPVTQLQSVSVLTETCLRAGTCSTIAMLKGPRDGAEYLRSCNVDSLMIDAAGETIMIPLANSSI